MKRRPEGKDLEKFVELWYSTDHQGKVDLCEKDYGVPYTIARHWVSDAGMTRKQEKEPVNTLHNTLTEAGILAINPATALDFVMFDLETSGFDADWDILLTACIKPYGQDPITFRADNYPTWRTHKANDKQITLDISNELKKHAIIIGHYSKSFDIRFIRAKMLRHGIPVLPPMFGIDTWKIAFDNFKISSRRLSNIARLVNADEKEEVDGTRWMRAAFNGDTEAMDKIMEHNILDCRVLEKVACLSFPFMKSIPKL